MVGGLVRSHRRRAHQLACQATEGSWWCTASTSGVQQADDPCSTTSLHQARALCTSSAAQSWEKYQRVLRQPVPKAHVLNRSNYQAWTQTGLDVGLAQQLLADLDAPSSLRSGTSVTAAVRSLIQDAGTVAELVMVEQQVGEFMSPDQIISAAFKALGLQDQALQSPPSASSAYLHPIVLRDQVSALLSSLMARLPPRLTPLSTGHLATLLFCLTRTPDMDTTHLQSLVVEELMVGGSYRLADCSPALTATLLRSAAQLRWFESHPGAWAVVASAALRGADPSDATITSKLVSAACQEGKADSALWDHVSKALQQHSKHWSAQQPVLLADMLHRIAKSRFPCPVELPEITDTLLQQAAPGTTEHTPRSLARLAWALPRLSQRAPESQPAVAAAMQQVWAAVAAHVPRTSLSDLSKVLTGISLMAQQNQLSPAAPPLLRVIRDVVAVRGLTSAASVEPTLSLLHQLAAVQGQQHGLLQVLTGRAVKLLPRLPAEEVAAVALCWTQHASSPLASQVLSAAATQLLGTFSSDPSTWEDISPLLTTLHACCISLSARQPGAGVAEGTATELRQLTMQLADKLLLVPEVVAAAVAAEQEQSQQLRHMLSSPAVGLQNHGLLLHIK